MKSISKNSYLLASMLVLGVVGCGGNKAEDKKSTPTPVPAAPTAPTAPADAAVRANDRPVTPTSGVTPTEVKDNENLKKLSAQDVIKMIANKMFVAAPELAAKNTLVSTYLTGLFNNYGKGNAFGDKALTEYFFETYFSKVVGTLSVNCASAASKAATDKELFAKMLNSFNVAYSFKANTGDKDMPIFQVKSYFIKEGAKPIEKPDVQFSNKVDLNAAIATVKGSSIILNWKESTMSLQRYGRILGISKNKFDDKSAPFSATVCFDKEGKTVEKIMVGTQVLVPGK